MSSRALEEVRRAVAASEDADDVLRDTVRALASEPGVSWAGIAFVEGETLALGPSAGTPNETRRTSVPVVFHGDTVGELRVDGEVAPALLDEVAALVAAHVLLGWDTGGEAWVP